GERVHTADDAGFVQLLAHGYGEIRGNHCQHLTMLQPASRRLGRRTLRPARSSQEDSARNCVSGNAVSLTVAGGGPSHGSRYDIRICHWLPRYGLCGGCDSGGGRSVVLHQLGNVVADGSGTGWAADRRGFTSPEPDE